MSGCGSTAFEFHETKEYHETKCLLACIFHKIRHNGYSKRRSCLIGQYISKVCTV